MNHPHLDVTTPSPETCPPDDSAAAGLRAEIRIASRRIQEPGDRREDRFFWRARLAALLRELADHEAEPAHIETALVCYEATLAETTAEDAEAHWRETNALMGSAQLDLFRSTHDTAWARRAVRPLENARSRHPAGSRAGRELARRVGEALLAVGRHEKDADIVRQAVASYRSALVFSEDGHDDVLEQAASERALAVALRVLGTMQSEVEPLEEALRLIESAVGRVGDAEPFTRMLLASEARRVREALVRQAPGSMQVRRAILAYGAGQSLL